jgi:hypothetical protein
MEELFDPTRIVERVAEYVAFPDHPHDEACFYGLPFAHDRERVRRVRKDFAQATIRFYCMNHLGLRSNCSSFAEYLRTRRKVDAGKMPNLFSYLGSMYPYNGQHLTFGDVLAIQYLRDEGFSNGFFDSEVRDQTLFEAAARRREDAESPCFLRAYARGLSGDASREIVGRRELLRLSRNFFLGDYHFLTCVGYEIHGETGNLEPVFLGQNGRNFPTSRKEKRILLPPFGNLELSFLSRHVAPGTHTPALVFCSKPF